MEKSKRRDIQRLFPSRRISSLKDWVTIFSYIPIGILLAVLRFCLSVNFVIAQQILALVFERENAVLKMINQLFFMILGIRVTVHGAALHTDVIVCNKRSHIDGLIFSHAINAFSENYWNLPSVLCKMLRLREKSLLQSPNLEAGKSHSTVVFPEGTPTSGTGIMKFDPSYFENLKSVQTCCLRVSRYMPISLSTIDSGFWSDLFWTFFQPTFTFYTITLSKSCINKENMNSKEFADAAVAEIAEMLKVPALQVSFSDKENYLKCLEEERATRNQHRLTVSPALLQMATQVQEITPHVPRDVILSDLAKTHSVDVTLANIFEGVVKFTPVQHNTETAEPQKRFEKKIPQTPLEKRKAELYELARRRFKEKHAAKVEE